MSSESSSELGDEEYCDEFNFHDEYPSQRLTKNLAPFPKSGFTTKRHTDVTIVCQGKEFHAHKVILSAQSEFFDKAFDPDSPMVEARTGIINLDEDDPRLVEAMLSYCYTCDLKIESLAKKLHHHSRSEYLMTYALVYSIADKYRVAGLKEIAGDDFFYNLQSTYFGGNLSPKIFAQVTRKVFESTPESDRRLRDPLLNYAASYIDKFMIHKRFKAHMDKIEGFWGQLVEVSVARKERKRCCPICAEKMMTTFDNLLTPRSMDHPVHCKKCKQYSKAKDWNKPVDEGLEDDWSEEEADSATTSNKRKRIE